MSDILTSKHYEAFGFLTHLYAVIETSIKFSISGMLNQPVHLTFITTAPHSSLQLKNTAKSVAKVMLPEKDSKYFCNLIGQWSASTTLRNSIAHNRWTKGARPQSIRPIYMDIRSGKAVAIGFEDTEKDWTLLEIQKVGNSLVETNESIKGFLTSSGLEAVIARNIDPLKSSIEDLDDDV